MILTLCFCVAFLHADVSRQDVLFAEVVNIREKPDYTSKKEYRVKVVLVQPLKTLKSILKVTTAAAHLYK